MGRLILPPNVGGIAAPGQIANQGVRLPIYTLLTQLGLTLLEVQSTGDEIWRRVRRQLRKKALSDDPDTQRKYLNDHNYRWQVNTQITAEVLLGMGFDSQQLRELDTHLRLGMVTPAPREKPVATVAGPNGPEEIEVLDAPGLGEVGTATVKSRTTGKITRIRPDYQPAD